MPPEIPVARESAGRRASPVPRTRCSDADFAGAQAGGDLTGVYPAPVIATDAVGGAEVADDALTGADLDESTLAGLVRGDGQVLSGQTTGAAGGAATDVVTIVEVPGLFELFAGCTSNGGSTLAIVNRNQQPLLVWRDDGATNPATATLSTNQFDQASTQPAPDLVTWQGIWAGRRITAIASSQFTEGGVVDTCRFQGHVLLSG